MLTENANTRIRDKERVVRQNIVCCFSVFLIFVLLMIIKVEVHRVRADRRDLIGSTAIIWEIGIKEQIGLKRLDDTMTIRIGRVIAAVFS